MRWWQDDRYANGFTNSSRRIEVFPRARGQFKCICALDGSRLRVFGITSAVFQLKREIQHMPSGGCLCGAIRYRIQGDLAPIEICHCSQCRRAQGTPFASNIPIRSERFTLVQGSESLTVYASSPGKERLFCRHCGSPVISRRTGVPDWVRVRAGTLDAPVPARPRAHFHVASKADWWDIEDDLPRYAERD